MSAYLIAEHLITEAALFEQYRSNVAPMIERYGGRYLTRAGAHEVLSGQWKPTRAVIIEFPDMASLKEWYDSSEYKPLAALRRETGPEVLIAVEGAG